MIEFIEEGKIDVLIVAGDIFDTPMPSHDALSAYFDFLHQVTLKTDCHIFVIAGNHDSGHFLEAPRELLQKQNIHVVGKISKDLQDHHKVFTIKGEEILISFLPYFRQYEILKHLGSTEASPEQISNFFTSFFQMASAPEYKDIKNKILIAHHLFGSYESSGSEQVVSLSGLDSFPRNLYQDHYQYVALGHIHKTQTLHHHPHVIYPGSPIAMRFGESEQKYISVFNTSEEEIVQEFVKIPVFYPLKQLKTEREILFKQLDKIIVHANEHEFETLLEVNVRVQEPENNLVDEVKKHLQGSSVSLLSFYMSSNQVGQISEKRQDIISLSPDELFEFYYENKYPETKIPKTLKEDFNWLMDITMHGQASHEN